MCSTVHHWDDSHRQLKDAGKIHLEGLELSGTCVAWSAAYTALSPLVGPVCILGVAVWYVGAVGGGIADYDDCIAVLLGE